jgi:hypothetical protein
MSNVVSLLEHARKKDKDLEQREEHNRRVLEKLKNGDNLCTGTTQDSWFPPKGVFDRTLGRMVTVKGSKEEEQ